VSRDQVEELNAHLLDLVGTVYPGLGGRRPRSGTAVETALSDVADEVDRVLAHEERLPRATVALCLFVMRSLIDEPTDLALARQWHDRLNQTFGPISVTG